MVKLSHLPPLSRAVAERVIHASADPGYAADLILDEAALAAGVEALEAGSPVIVDSRMVASGITTRQTRCLLDVAGRRGRWAGTTRSACGVRQAATGVGPGAVWVIGCAPTALTELIGCAGDPALVIGLPVGFVGAVEAKAALAASGLPALTNRGPKGGSAVAAAALNALLYAERGS